MEAHCRRPPDRPAAGPPPTPRGQSRVAPPRARGAASLPGTRRAAGRAAGSRLPSSAEAGLAGGRERPPDPAGGGRPPSSCRSGTLAGVRSATGCPGVVFGVAFAFPGTNLPPPEENIVEPSGQGDAKKEKPSGVWAHADHPDGVDFHDLNVEWFLFSPLDPE
ncbi:collagen alpha-1(I) chain-like [Felis catus]|uniref:collagen alpha-1(I) chain-like n=1 Tax=Felis catus TaxID=9685 RepID=UPI001D19FE44|nr:collagen alpha-1(I) chain-like [Felis catus]